MESSLRYEGGDAKNHHPATIKSIRINAKQKLQIFHPDTLLQLNGELDTCTGAPTFFCALVRHLYPNLVLELDCIIIIQTTNSFVPCVGKRHIPCHLTASLMSYLKAVAIFTTTSLSQHHMELLSWFGTS